MALSRQLLRVGVGRVANFEGGGGGGGGGGGEATEEWNRACTVCTSKRLSKFQAHWRLRAQCGVRAKPQCGEGLNCVCVCVCKARRYSVRCAGGGSGAREVSSPRVQTRKLSSAGNVSRDAAPLGACMAV